MFARVLARFRKNEKGKSEEKVSPAKGTFFFFFFSRRRAAPPSSQLLLSFSLCLNSVFSPRRLTPPFLEAMQCSLAQSTRVAAPVARRGAVAVRAVARPER